MIREKVRFWKVAVLKYPPIGMKLQVNLIGLVIARCGLEVDVVEKGVIVACRRLGTRSTARGLRNPRASSCVEAFALGISCWHMSANSVGTGLQIVGKASLVTVG